MVVVLGLLVLHLKKINLLHCPQFCTREEGDFTEKEQENVRKRNMSS